MTLDKRRELARNCFGCGRSNPFGLQLYFEALDGRVEAEFTPEQKHQGFPGIVHGGITATLLDEAMGWASYASGIHALTAKMETKFRAPIPLGSPVRVIGELMQDKGRLLLARAEIRTLEGRLLAESSGVFLRMRNEALISLGGWGEA